MLRTSLTAFVLAASASFALAATDDELKQQIVGAWGQDATCSTGSLTFNADGTFVFAQPGSDPMGGTWTLAGGVLSGVRADGGAQPDATVAFADGKMTMTEKEGSQREAVFERCPA